MTTFEYLEYNSFVFIPDLIKNHSGSLENLKENISKNGNFDVKKKSILAYILPNTLVDNESAITEKDKIIIANIIFYYNDLNESTAIFGQDYPYFSHMKYIGNNNEKTKENLNKLYVLQEKIDFNIYDHSIEQAKSFHDDTMIRHGDNKVGVFLTSESSKGIF